MTIPNAIAGNTIEKIAKNAASALRLSKFHPPHHATKLIDINIAIAAISANVTRFLNVIFILLTIKASRTHRLQCLGRFVENGPLVQEQLAGF